MCSIPLSQANVQPTVPAVPGPRLERPAGDNGQPPLIVPTPPTLATPQISASANFAATMELLERVMAQRRHAARQEAQRQAYDADPRNFRHGKKARFPSLADRYGREELASTSHRCPICGHDSWCLIYGASGNAAVLCMRESAGALRQKCIDGGETGYVHELDEAQFPRQRRRETSRAAAPAPATAQSSRIFDDWIDLQIKCVLALRDYPGALEAFAASLGLTPEGLAGYHVGWWEEHAAYSAPMRGSAGEIIGIHLRTPAGKKFAICGSRNGLFLPPELNTHQSLQPYGGVLTFSEGLSDAATLAAWGFAAVGRPSCSGGVDLAQKLVRRLRPEMVVVVADNDSSGAGQRGAAQMAAALAASGVGGTIKVVRPPPEVKDIREWRQRGASPADMHALVVHEATRRVRVCTNARRTP